MPRLFFKPAGVPSLCGNKYLIICASDIFFGLLPYPPPQSGADSVAIKSMGQRLMLSRALTRIIVALLLLTGAWSGARAQQPVSAGQASPTTGWQFDIAPYIWFPTVNTSLQYQLPANLGGRLPTDVSVGPGDLYSHIDYGGMFSADVRNGPFSLLTDFMGARFSATTSDVNIKSVDFFGLPSIPISRALETSTGTTIGLAIWTLAGGYTVLQGDWGNLDVFAGFRFLSVNARTDYSLAFTLVGPRGNGATFGGIGDAKASRDIWNGIAGIRGRIRISQSRFFFPYYFDIGGGGSQPTWQIASGLGYQFRWGALSATYRYLVFNQGSNAVVQRVALRGPMLMVNFSF
jgi:hypothetical protein